MTKERAMGIAYRCLLALQDSTLYDDYTADEQIDDNDFQEVLVHLAREAGSEAEAGPT